MSGQADPTSASLIQFTVLFDEPVSGFTSGDVSLGGTTGASTAVVSESSPHDGTTYTVVVSGMSRSGTVIATVPAAVATDAAGNPNSADNSVAFVKGGTQPPGYRVYLPLVTR